MPVSPAGAVLATRLSRKYRSYNCPGGTPVPLQRSSIPIPATIAGPISMIQRTFCRLPSSLSVVMQNALSIDSGDDTVQDAAEGVRQSFAELVERHSRLVFRIALAITRSAQDAEDVAQETFLQIFR